MHWLIIFLGIFASLTSVAAFVGDLQHRQLYRGVALAAWILVLLLTNFIL